MFTKVLIANRGTIACRILRTLRRLGVASLAVYSDADRHSRHVREADEAVAIGPAPAAMSYLRQERLIEVALAHGAQAVHPGYGFLSENAEFAERCEAAGLVFIGPTPAQMRAFGLKHAARALAEAQEVPLLPGSGLLGGVAEALVDARRIGYPVMLKSTAGGGGIGMQLARDAGELERAYASVERLARSQFGAGGLFLEKYVAQARHIEVQVFGDGQGTLLALGERDCSVQRRNQKVIEETPAPHLEAGMRAAMQAAAIRLGRAVDYRSAGTVEFVYDAATRQFYFLEVNTRLQVEHGVTEEVMGVDLVEWMVRVAAGDVRCLADYRLHRETKTLPGGHSIQVRLYAEDPATEFRPSSGLLSEVVLPGAGECGPVRVETWVDTGTEVPAWYDPMLAKLIVHAPTRAQAIARLADALAATRLYGIETNLDYLRAVIADPVFQSGRQTTRFLEGFTWRPATVEVLQPGTHTTLQDYPGRTGLWDVGVPPSGPMDDLSFRLANRLLGNPPDAAALECTVTGPTLRFRAATRVALTGACMPAELDGQPVPPWTAVEVPAGATLRLRAVDGAGQRSYLAVQGGFTCPVYLGSRATFTLGQFGGHAGRALRAGDVLRLEPPDAARAARNSAEDGPALPVTVIPAIGNDWELAVLHGPHGAPDFFTDEDIAAFFAATWQVHYNSSRTGVRLLGPRPAWARQDGGEAGLHPSNIHDNAYAFGSIDFTGDMPVILGPDGPSLGGFVCPAVVIRADRWKLGQLQPGDRVRFHAVDIATAGRLAARQEAAVAALEPAGPDSVPTAAPAVPGGPVLATRAANAARSAPAVCYRQAGDEFLLVEYGPPVLDLELRFRVHELMKGLAARAMPGVLELTPGIRSLQVHYDGRRLPQRALLALLEETEAALPAVDDIEVESRIVHLPLSWDDPATRLAIDKYTQSVRADAPWCPSNIEFIRRINGLDSEEAVRRIVFDASYLVLGLGDVYLGAPVATPLDPRHRLVTTKYNPARTWTPENAVGIGGAYLCVYGLEGPGGYQFVGRTVQMWNRYRTTADFPDGRQWLLRFFDQIRFYPVAADQLLEMRDAFPQGGFTLRTEPATLRLRDYRAFLAEHAASIGAFKARQQAAFEIERSRWRETGKENVSIQILEIDIDSDLEIPADCAPLAAPVTGNVWQVQVQAGDEVAADQPLLVLEAMKMEIAVVAPERCQVIEVRCQKGRAVTAGDTLLVLRALNPEPTPG